jgi:cell division protein FtsQ
LVRRLRRFETVIPKVTTAGRALLPDDLRAPQVDPRSLMSVLRSRLLWMAALVILVLSVAVTWVHTDEHWFIYREDVSFYGLKYLDAEELWPFSGLDTWNVFWIDPSEVRAQLLQHPYVAEADVRVSQLGAHVTVFVTEARPVALWVTGAGERWLLDDGAALEPRGTPPPGLLKIYDVDAAATAPGVPGGTAIDLDVLRSAQGLASRLPGVAPLRYSREAGLNFQLPDQPYWVYWGDGEDVERKLEVLAAGEQLLASGEAEGEIIDVRYERPYIK